MIQHFPVLAIMVLFLGAFITVLCGKHAVLRNIVVGVCVTASFFFMAALIKPVMVDGQIFTYWLGGWTPVADYAIGICLTVDALSLFFGLLVSTAVMIAGFYSFKYMDHDEPLEKFFTLFLMLAGGVMGLVLSGDLFNMYVMVEILTFAAVALTAFRNKYTGALEAAFKYLIVGGIGSSCILFGTALLYAEFHTLNMAQLSVLIQSSSSPLKTFAFAMLFTGYSVKAFVFPFHPLAADAHAVAPSSVSVLISGVLTKSGVYGLIRIAYFVFRSMELSSMQFLFVFIGCISMFVCVTMALAQKDFKRLLAFHSISQIGYVMTAVGLCTGLGIAGGLYHAINHTLFKGLLFLCAGAVLYRTNTTKLDELGGLAKRMPKTAALFLIGAFCISGLPPFNGFVSKWMIYQALFQKASETGNIAYLLVLLIAMVVSVMTLASFIKVGQSVFFGQLPEKLKDVKETPLAMRLPMYVIAALCVGTGLFPNLMTKYLVNPAAQAVLNVGSYIDATMGAGYAARVGGVAIPATDASYVFSGYWNPLAWLLLLFTALAAVAIVSLTGKGLRGRTAVATTDSKYDTFFGGEASEYSHVAGSDLFWGFKHNFRHYLAFMHDAHSGIVNDYVFWAFCAMALTMLFMFMFI